MAVASEGILLKKKGLFEKKEEVKKGFLVDAKLAALKFKAGVALKKAALLGTLKAVKKAKMGLFDGMKEAKLNVLKTIAGVKLAKLAALKAGKLAFVKTLAAVKLAPYIAKKLGEDGFDKLGGLFKKDKFDLKDKFAKSPLDGILGIFGGGGLPFGEGGDNPLGSIIGDVLLGALSGGGGGGGGLPNFDLGGLLSGFSGLANLLPLPQPEQPAVNVDYQVNPAPIPAPVPIVTYEAPPPVIYEHPPSVSYEPEPIINSYGVPAVSGSSSSSFSQPATSYGVPEYN